VINGASCLRLYRGSDNCPPALAGKLTIIFFINDGAIEANFLFV